MAIINGTDNNDFIDQNDGVTEESDTISGLAGDDILFGLGGDDTIYGGDDDDGLFGGLGNDDLNGGSGIDVLDGNIGDDTLEGGAGADRLFGGDGNDTADYTDSAAGVTVNLMTGAGSGGDASGDTLSSIENLKGSGHADTLIGNDLDNTLVGNGGIDTLHGGLGDDTYAVVGTASTIIEGANAGDDTVYVLFEDSGSIKIPDNVETLAVLTEKEDVQITATGAAADETISGLFAKFRISGLGGDDQLSGGEESDWLSGGTGNDKLYGQEGADELIGSRGKDNLYGDAGRDVLTGGLDKDKLFGGADRDFFDFNSVKDSLKGSNRDTIEDFERGVDDIDLRTIDAKTGGGNQAFTFIGKNDFHDKKGELRYEDKGSKVIVQGDVNGDGKADFEILVKMGALSAGDFLL